MNPSMNRLLLIGNQYRLLSVIAEIYCSFFFFFFCFLGEPRRARSASHARRHFFRAPPVVRGIARVQMLQELRW